MIITQKYHSSQEIDPEFIDSLEELMREHVPSFEWIKMKEKLAPENIHYSYYLFFGNCRNSPVGYAQVAIKNEERTKSIKGLLFNKKKKEKFKELSWSSPSSTMEGIVFDPAFLKGGLVKTDEILNEYSSRQEVEQQALMVGDEIVAHAKLGNGEAKTKKKIVNCLVKNNANYKDYIEGLDKESQKEIKSLWKQVYKNSDSRIGEYENFKDCFAYKKKGSAQYKELRKSEKLSPYVQLADNFLTFESADEVFAIVFLFKGSHGQYFFKPAALVEGVSEALLTQASLMRFFEEDDCSKLRFLETTEQNSTLERWGFTSKNIHVLELKNK